METTSPSYDQMIEKLMSFLRNLPFTVLEVDLKTQKILFVNNNFGELIFRKNDDFMNFIPLLSRKSYLEAVNALALFARLRLKSFSLQTVDEKAVFLNLEFYKITETSLFLILLPLKYNQEDAAILENFAREIGVLQQNNQELRSGYAKLKKIIDSNEAKISFYQNQEKELTAEIEKLQQALPTEEERFKLNQIYEQNKKLLQEKKSAEELLAAAQETMAEMRVEFSSELDKVYGENKRLLADLDRVSLEKSKFQQKLEAMTRQEAVLLKKLEEATAEKQEQTLTNLIGIPDGLAFLLERIQQDLLEGDESTKAEALKRLSRYNYFVSQFKDIYASETELFDLTAFARQFQDEMVQKLPEEMSFFLALGRELKPVTVNSNQLKLLLEILLENSLEAFDNFDDLAEEPEIKVLLRNKIISGHDDLTDGEYLQIRFADSAIGFEGSLNNAFQPYYSNKKQHIGLGLTLLRYLVEKWGGMVSLSDTLDGALVEIYLPLFKESVQEESFISEDIIVPEEDAAADASGKDGDLFDAELNRATQFSDETAIVKIEAQKPLLIWVKLSDANAAYQQDLLSFLENNDCQIVQNIEAAELVLAEGVYSVMSQEPKILQAPYRIWLCDEYSREDILEKMGGLPNSGNYYFDKGSHTNLQEILRTIQAK